MKERVLMLFALLFFYYSSNSQNYVDENYNCELLQWKLKHIYNPTSVDTIAIIDVECLIIRNQYEKGMRLLDSLIEKNKDNPKLYLHKAFHQVNKNSFDTTYFNNFRIALKLGADSSSTLYNIGIYYLNFVMSCNDSLSPIKIKTSDKFNLINRAEYYVKQAAAHDKNYLADLYEFLSKTKEYKAEISNIALKPFSIDENFDTLLLMAKLMDCGEFGGHIEYIKCYYHKGELKAVFWKDNPICEIEFSKENIIENNFKNTPQTISKELLSKYVNYVININKNPSMVTNAPTLFWIIKDNDPFFISDWTGNSNEYEVFRNNIFKE
ncbi:MAG: hypothetical protein IPO21_10205 [Bacteroidales bacterium]|nr:hypothetical protein [Bacteroidales bacterium]